MSIFNFPFLYNIFADTSPDDDIVSAGISKLAAFLKERIGSPVASSPGGGFNNINSPSGVSSISSADKLESVQSLIVNERYNWNFPILEIHNLSHKRSLVFIGISEFIHLKLIDKFELDESILINFLCEVERSYQDLPYHNSIHAAEVLRSSCYFIEAAKMAEKCQLMPLEVLALVLAAIIHDVDHPGFNNDFLISASTDLAVLYNDASPLENHHAAQGFRILLKDNNFFLAHLPPSEYKYLRKMMITLVLQTDLKCHFPLVKQLQDKCDVSTSNPWDFSKYEDRLLVCGIAIKCADISHSSKTFEAHVTWSRRVIDEFFSQGDEEKRLGLNVSPLCDRKSIDVAKSQSGFINFLCIPLFKTFTEFLAVPEVTRVIMSQLTYNETEWIKEHKLGTEIAGQSTIINISRRKSIEDKLSIGLSAGRCMYIYIVLICSTCTNVYLYV